MFFGGGGICGFIDRQFEVGVEGCVEGKRGEGEGKGWVKLFDDGDLEELRKIREESWTRRGERRVLVHCEKGFSRSPMVLIAYLMRQRRAPLDEVLKEVRGKRRVRPNGSFMEQLRVWEETGYEI